MTFINSVSGPDHLTELSGDLPQSDVEEINSDQTKRVRQRLAAGTSAAPSSSCRRERFHHQMSLMRDLDL